MKDFLHKLLFPKRHKEYIFYKRTHDIHTSYASEEQIIELLPLYIEGGELDIERASYVSDGKVVYNGGGRRTDLTRRQSLINLFLDLKEDGYLN